MVQQPASAEATPESQFKDAVPLLQSLVWAILLAAVLFGFRKELSHLIERIKNVKVSAEGVEIETVETASVVFSPEAVPRNTASPVQFRVR